MSKRKLNLLKLPLQLEEHNQYSSSLTNEALFSRNNAIREINSVLLHKTHQLSVCDSLIKYASELLTLLSNDEYRNSLSTEVSELVKIELVITVVNAAHVYKEISIDTMRRAYSSEAKDAFWSTSGVYLTYGLGLLEFLLQEQNQFQIIKIDQEYYELIISMESEFKVIQQLGIVTLTLSRLRKKMYNDSKDAVLDFQNEDITELSKNSNLYAKLVIGCIDYAKTLRSSKHINKVLVTYLEALAFLLLSMDQFAKDETGIAVGMIEESFEKMSNFISNTKLHDSVLLKSRKRDKLKSMFQKKQSSTEANSINLDKNSKLSTILQRQLPIMQKEKLSPLLENTIDDFLLPLSTLLYYRYKKTNDTLFFKPIINDHRELLSLFPQGKSPDLAGSKWYFNNNEIQLMTEASKVSPNKVNITYF
ncbi:hypothetical protein TPHA_0D03170 [Tetrapisispora phaffii CBS 4417]|uniref:Uncharacterized protein n=1 Tax=Tetrapisispora phaffii (strain ATCC 24235 / CBS 4417 / NBRC 1672 / NRRL Y-8282 / UCD 70-5) TaxID=1071381 RepID=G8BSY2_TETPH|nr:hypothetical protein TPHA_0D03170 [Tetrapisispora phaffii CBS 4417]CCE62953.1 hypothetical protein TPHA_0D03170 [Tetrapisispora phaffii CBS 4417]